MTYPGVFPGDRIVDVRIDGLCQVELVSVQDSRYRFSTVVGEPYAETDGTRGRNFVGLGAPDQAADDDDGYGNGYVPAPEDDLGTTVTAFGIFSFQARQFG